MKKQTELKTESPKKTIFFLLWCFFSRFCICSRWINMRRSMDFNWMAWQKIDFFLRQKKQWYFSFCKYTHLFVCVCVSWSESISFTLSLRLLAALSLLSSCSFTKPFHISSYLLLRTHFVPLEIKFINDFYFRQRCRRCLLIHDIHLIFSLVRLLACALYVSFGDCIDAMRPFHNTGSHSKCCFSL